MYLEEGGNVGRPPLFNVLKYAYWASQLRAFMLSLGDRVWFLVKNDWTYLTETLPDTTVIPKTPDPMDL